MHHLELTVESEHLGDLLEVLGQMDAGHPPEPHWYLAWIGVDKAMQGRGLGNELLASCLKGIDTDHATAYLDNTNPMNVPFYERHGFRVTGGPEPNVCRTDQPTLYDVTMTVKNAADIASDGHVWALDAYTQHVQVWRLGQQHYCFRIEYDGTWTSFAGTSPGGTGTISDGLTGTFHGVRLARLTGEFNPQYPLSGHVADFDRQCGADGTCTGSGPSFGMYFSPIVNVNVVWSDFLATSATNGSWHQTPYGDFGDITD